MHTQRKRSEKAALYELTKPAWHRSRYEVVRIRARKARKWGNIAFEAGEVYPATETWGRDGWSFSDEESAIRKYRAIA